MQHLELEVLARLVDGAPARDEQVHLDACARCRAELDALCRQTESLRALPDLRPPVGDWEALERRLAREGLIRSGTRRRWWARQDVWLRAAAAAVLFLGGTAFGRALGGGLSGTGPAVAGSGAESALERVTSADEAAEIARLAQQRYFDALLRYRELVGADAGDAAQGQDPARRFAALEAIVAASQAAVRTAPADPFLNGVLVSAVAEREQVLRQIASAQGDNWF